MTNWVGAKKPCANINIMKSNSQSCSVESPEFLCNRAVSDGLSEDTEKLIDKVFILLAGIGERDAPRDEFSGVSYMRRGCGTLD